MKEAEMIVIKAEFKKETEKAIIFNFNGADIILPKSQVNYFEIKPEMVPGKIINVKVAKWIASKRGIL